MRDQERRKNKNWSLVLSECFLEHIQASSNPTDPEPCWVRLPLQVLTPLHSQATGCTGGGKAESKRCAVSTGGETCQHKASYSPLGTGWNERWGQGCETGHEKHLLYVS